MKNFKYLFVGLILLFSFTFIIYFIKEHIELINIALIHLIPVIIVALSGNILVTFIFVVVSVLFFDVLYVPPLYSFTVYEQIYIWTFLIFILVGLVISYQAKRIRVNEIKEILLNLLSHDLKTPLSSMLGSTTLLLEETKLDDNTKREIYLDIKNSIDSMNRLIINLLDTAKLIDLKQKEQFNWCDIEDTFYTTLNEFPEYSANRIKIDIDPNLPLFWGDNILLSRLFANLLENGFKYSVNTPIIIKITHDFQKITLSFFNESEPLNKTKLKRIFDKYNRLENHAQLTGTGIGLALCKQIVHFHHGEIVAMNKGSGILFEITLPLKKRPKELKEI